MTNLSFLIRKVLRMESQRNRSNEKPAYNRSEDPARWAYGSASVDAALLVICCTLIGYLKKQNKKQKTVDKRKKIVH